MKIQQPPSTTLDKQLRVGRLMESFSNIQSHNISSLLKDVIFMLIIVFKKPSTDIYMCMRGGGNFIVTAILHKLY